MAYRIARKNNPFEANPYVHPLYGETEPNATRHLSLVGRPRLPHVPTNGAKGGRNGQTGGFASDKIGADGLSGSERASIAGQTGGRISKRPPTHYVYYNGAKISLSAFAKKVGISYYVALKNYHAGEYENAS